MNSIQRRHFVDLLLDERARNSRALERIALPPEMTFESDRPARTAMRSPARRPVEVSMTTVRSPRTSRGTLDEIDTALRTLYEDPDRFGVCAVCGHRISLGRLALVPTTRYCQEHAPDN